MAQIAEELLLLLLDNASAQPALDDARLDRLLPAAILLDLAYACRIRPAVATEPAEPGSLVALMGPYPVDPVVAPALHLLTRRPLSPAAAIAKLRKTTQFRVLDQLERSGQIRPTRLAAPPKRGLRVVRRGMVVWPLTDRTRVMRARGALLSTLFDNRCPEPSTAAIISLLHAVDGLGSLLSLNDRGWAWVNNRAGEIASGSWVDEFEPPLPDVNLAVTTAAVRAALM